MNWGSHCLYSFQPVGKIEDYDNKDWYNYGGNTDIRLQEINLKAKGQLKYTQGFEFPLEALLTLEWRRDKSLPPKFPSSFYPICISAIGYFSNDNDPNEIDNFYRKLFNEEQNLIPEENYNDIKNETDIINDVNRNLVKLFIISKQ